MGATAQKRDVARRVGGSCLDIIFFCSRVCCVSSLDGAALLSVRRQFRLADSDTGRWRVMRRSPRRLGLGSSSLRVRVFAVFILRRYCLPAPPASLAGLMRRPHVSVRHEVFTNVVELILEVARSLPSVR